MSNIEPSQRKRSWQHIAHDYLTAREEELSEARKCVEDMQRNTDQGCSLGIELAVSYGMGKY